MIEARSIVDDGHVRHNPGVIENWTVGCQFHNRQIGFAEVDARSVIFGRKRQVVERLRIGAACDFGTSAICCTLTKASADSRVLLDVVKHSVVVIFGVSALQARNVFLAAPIQAIAI